MSAKTALEGSKGSKGSRKKEKAQASVEYLSIFTAALILLVIVIAVIGMYVLNSNTSTYSPSSCYISPDLNCQQIVVTNNGIQAHGVIVFTNNLDQPMYFSTSNSFSLSPSYTQKSYEGTCLPSNAVPGAEVVCNVTINNYNPSLGTQLNPRFQIIYSQCPSGTCTSTPVNTTGSGTTYVSSAFVSLYTVKLLANPSSAGTISVDGVSYSSGTSIYFLKSVAYTIYANPSSGYNFGSWTSQGGVTVQQLGSQGTTAFATGNGIITANFNPVTTVISPTVTLALQNAYNQQGNSDLASAATSGVGDGVAINYCSTPTVGSPCPSSFTQYCMSATNTAACNVGTLPIGNYILQSCDTTFSPTTCSANVTLQQVVYVGEYPCWPLTIQESPSSAAPTPTESPSNSINCPAGNYIAGALVQLTAFNPFSYPNWVFFNWAGTASYTGLTTYPSESYPFVMPYSPATETANYAQCFPLTLRALPSDAAAAPTATPSAYGCPSGEYAQGESVTVTASSPNSGYTFASWSGQSTSATFTMPGSSATENANYQSSVSCNAGCPSSYTGVDKWVCTGTGVDPMCGSTAAGASASCSPGSVTSSTDTCTPILYDVVASISPSACSPDSNGNSAMLFNGASVSPSSGDDEGGYAKGTVISIFANPTVYGTDHDTCTFTGWAVSGATTGNPSAHSTTITINGATTVTADYSVACNSGYVNSGVGCTSSTISSAPSAVNLYDNDHICQYATYDNSGGQIDCWTLGGGTYPGEPGGTWWDCYAPSGSTSGSVNSAGSLQGCVVGYGSGSEVCNGSGTATEAQNGETIDIQGCVG